MTTEVLMMADVPAKIGIVSKHAHCKSHMAALSRDGFDVVALGGSPTTIPPSIDVVVVRTESCAHQGSQTAVDWGRETGKPVIMENGLSGIRRALGAPTKEEREYQKYRRAAEMLLRDRPEDTQEQVRDTLVAMGASLAVAHRVVESVDTLKPTPTEENLVSLFPTPYPDPEQETWGALVPEDRARSQAEIGLQVYLGMEEEVRETIANIFLPRMAGEGPYFPSSNSKDFKGKKWESFRGLHGKPHQFSVVLLLCLPKDEPYMRKPLQRAYQTFSGKRTDGRVAQAAAWATGHTVILEKTWTLPAQVEEAQVEEAQEVEEAQVAQVAQEAQVEEAQVEEAQEAQVEEAQVEEAQEAQVKPGEDFTGRMKRLQDEVEDQILELMSQMALVKKENEDLHAEVKDLHAEVRGLREEAQVLREEAQVLREEAQGLRDIVEAKRADNNLDSDKAPEVTTLAALGQLKEALDDLRKTGAQVSMEIKL
jgi:outer membrane biosynthesis protein TonB